MKKTSYVCDECGAEIAEDSPSRITIKIDGIGNLNVGTKDWCAKPHRLDFCCLGCMVEFMRVEQKVVATQQMETCKDCLHRPPFSQHCCHPYLAWPKHIDDMDSIPIWCPLEDSEAGERETNGNG